MEAKKRIFSTEITRTNDNLLNSIIRRIPLIVAAALFIATLTAFVPAMTSAAMTSCQHCKKKVDDSNSVCPYCLSDMNAPAVSVSSPAKDSRPTAAPAKSSQTSVIKAGRAGASSFAAALAARTGGAETLVTEQQLRVFLEDTLLKRFHNDNSNQRIKIEIVKRDAEDNTKFKVVGTAFNQSGRPMNTVGGFIEILGEHRAIVQSNLNHAAKVDINDPTLVNYTITLKIDPFNKVFSQSPKAMQPIDFTFVVPPSQSESVSVKILKINADSKSVLYDMQNKPGDKVTLSLIAEAGMKVVVMINEKTVYEKKY